MFIFWLLLICMTQKFYFVCSAYEKYELSPNCIAITICSNYLRNLESICCKWRDQTTNFWFFTRFPRQIWQHDCHIFQSSISLNFKKDVIFDKSSFRRCNFVYSNIVSYNLKEKWKIYVVQCSVRYLCTWSCRHEVFLIRNLTACFLSSMLFLLENQCFLHS